MKQEFLNHIIKNKFFESNQKILLAVSGGLDSMVMLHLFKEIEVYDRGGARQFSASRY